jgi:hypothetical protein
MIKVLRLMEYTYPDQKTADEDIARWVTPAVGTYKPNSFTTIRSTIMLPKFEEDPE